MFKFILIWRYFIRRPITMVAVVAITLLVMLVLVVLSVMSGLLAEQQLKNYLWSGDVVLARESLVGFDHYQELIDILMEEGLALDATPVIKGFALGPDEKAVEVFGLQMREKRQR